MAPAAPALLDLQRAVRASLLVHEDRGISAYVTGADISASERLDIYRNTFASVLTTALRLTYPAVHRLVGADFFEGAARIFIARHPPKCACLDDYGAEFPGFLAGFAPAASLPYLPDVARLEWAINRVLHAPDAEPLDAQTLATLGEAESVRVRFTAHPSIGMLRAECPVDGIWRAVLEQDDGALAAIDLSDGPVFLLVQRLQTGIDVRRMTESAWRFTAALCAGRPLAAALDEAQDFDAAALLADHIAAGRFVDFSLDETSPENTVGNIS